MLTLAWAVSNPPFAAPDEQDHYIRAIGLVDGQLIGKPTRDLPLTYRRLPYNALIARRIRMPADLWANGLTCDAFNSYKPAGCLNAIQAFERQTDPLTFVTGYEPAPYVLPGLLASLEHDPLTADRVARLGCAALCLCFLALAVLLLWGRDPVALSLVGIVVAVTPMVVFTASILNPSGIEIISSTAFAAALLRLTRSSNAPHWVWVAVALSGATLALSRTPGPAWIVFDCAAVLSLRGIEDLRAVGRGAKRAVRFVAAIVISAMIASVAWEIVYGPPASVHVGSLFHAIRPTLAQLPNKFIEAVGVFGWLDAPMPEPFVLAWQGAFVGLIAIALGVGSRRERWALVGVVAAGFVISTAFGTWYRALTGEVGFQGRHLLPMLAVIPLVAGEVVYRRSDRIWALSARHLFVPFVSLAALVQGIGWWWNARRQSQGLNGRVLFFESPAWSPPLGWITWVVVVIVALLLFLSSALLTIRHPRRSRSSPSLS